MLEEVVSKVNQILNNFFYDLEVADQLRGGCIIQNKDADSLNILKNSITHQRRKDYDACLMKDEISVRQTIEKGVMSPDRTDLDIECIIWEIARS